jgi:glycerate dehydrogenase
MQKGVSIDAIVEVVNSLTLPSNRQSSARNMIGAKELAMMPRDTILINTTRGEQALALALKSGVIGGAGFDVLTGEPLKDGNVLLEIDLPNLMVTPQYACASQEVRIDR